MRETVKRLQNNTADFGVLKLMIRRLQDNKARYLSSKKSKDHSHHPSHPPPLSNVPSVPSVPSVPNVSNVSNMSNTVQEDRVGKKLPQVAKAELEEAHS